MDSVVPHGELETWMLLHDPMLYWGSSQPEAPFLTDAVRTVSYGEGARFCQRTARALAAHGIRPGSRVCVLAGNHAELMLAYYGASMAGVVAVPLSPRLAPPEWEQIIADADAAILLATADLVGGTRLAADPPCLAITLGERQLPRWTDFAEWLTAGDAAIELPAVDESQDVLQLYTSGTTGRPKGAVFTHGAISGVMQRWQIHGLRVGAGNRVYVSMPVCLAAGMLTALNAIQNGAEIMLAAAFVPAEVVRILDEEGIAATSMAPTMVQRCLEVDGVSERSYPNLKYIQYGAAAMPETVLRRAIEVFGCDFYQGFGLTEASTISMLTPRDHRIALQGQQQLLASAGRPQMGVQLRIVDESGADVAAGVPGEIWVKGDFIMKEYWRAPELTAAALTDGWLHSGDVGYLDENGVLFVVDRVKDMIVSGGLNVYPREVERVIERFPQVAQVAVIGVPSQHWGEEVKAIVQLVPGGELTAKEIVRRCREELGRYKVPKSVDFVESFPVNSNGKMLKRELRESYARAAAPNVPWPGT